MTERDDTTPPQDDPVTRLAAANPVTTLPENLDQVWERIEPRLNDLDVEIDTTPHPSTTAWRRRSVQVAAAAIAAIILGSSGFAIGWTTAAPASPPPTPSPTPTAVASPTPSPSASASASASAAPTDIPLSQLAIGQQDTDGVDVDASALPDETTTAPVWQLAPIDPKDPRLDAMAAALGLSARQVDTSGTSAYTWRRTTGQQSDTMTVQHHGFNSQAAWEVTFQTYGPADDCQLSDTPCATADPEPFPASKAVSTVIDLLTQAGFDASTLTVTARVPSDGSDGVLAGNGITEVNVAVNDGATLTGGPAMTFTLANGQVARFRGWPTRPTSLGDYPVISPRAAAARLTDPTYAFTFDDSASPWVGPITRTAPDATPSDPEVSSTLPVPWSILPVRLVSAYLTTDAYIGVDGRCFLLPTWLLVDDGGTVWRAPALDASALRITNVEREMS